MRVVLSRNANTDLLSHIEWLASQSPSAARAARTAILSGLRTLAQFPASGRKTETGEHEWPIRFGRGGFIAVYRIERDRVIVGRIFDMRQDRR